MENFFKREDSIRETVDVGLVSKFVGAIQNEDAHI